MGNFTKSVLSAKERHPFGEVVAALAALSGATEVQSAIQAASILASLAGPRGGLVGLGGEVQPIGSSMISVGGDSPEQARLTELLISPLRYLQEDLIDYSARVDPSLRNQLAATLADPDHTNYEHRQAVVEAELEEAELGHAARQAGKSARMVSTCHPFDRYEEFEREQARLRDRRETDGAFAAYTLFANIDYETMLEYNEARCLREPIVLLENPDSQALLRGMDQVDHRSPFVLDSDGRLLAGVFGQRRHKAAEVIEGLLSGRSTRTTGEGGARPGRGILFSITDRLRLSQWMNQSEESSLLSRALLLDPTNREGDKENPGDIQGIREGYARFRETVGGVLTSRRLQTPGLYPILEGETSELFFRAQCEFREQINEVEPSLKPYAAHFVHLPATMLWSLKRLSHDDCRYRDLIPTATRLAEAAMRTHLEIVKYGLEAGERQKLEDEGRVMLRKLLRYEPCRFRELYRKYDDQDVSLHRPVFEYLIETERVQEVEKGVFRVTEQGRRQLEAVGVN
ncbi:MAG: hypothetical protein P1U58_14165 [Verrucomicrobiales bacterium]|nr:hypothetical protein [Verrucomicrobiales bacterium]